MPSRDFTRSDRISAELRRQLGAMVHEAVRDHALPSMSVSDVEVTRDFDFATVFVTALLPDQAVEGVEFDFVVMLARMQPVEVAATIDAEQHGIAVEHEGTVPIAARGTRQRAGIDRYSHGRCG